MPITPTHGGADDATVVQGDHIARNARNHAGTMPGLQDL
jgi:hypothetical protein